MPKIVAEIGCNHRGDFSVALEMVSTAARFCGVDVVKFQKRHNRTLLTPEQYAAPHPTPSHAYGATYGEHREALEFDLEHHRQLQAACAEHRVEYSTSVWDPVSAREIASLSPRMIKVPSACNVNWPLLEVVTDLFAGEIHVSLGMTTQKDVESIVAFFEARSRAQDVVLYACTSAYPVAFDDICLLEITRLRDAFAGRVKAIGFSGHHLGIAADIAALALGAEWFERHLTLDRTWKGSDHAASLEPDGLRRLCRDLRAVARALRPRPDDGLDAERPQLDRLKWRPAGRG